MAQQMTQIRCGKQFRLAIGVQSAEGTPAASALETLWATNGAWMRGRVIEDIAGSYGTISKPRYARIATGFEPKITCTIKPTRKTLPAILRNVYGNSYVSSLTETGDVDAELDAWKLYGVIPFHNTDANRKLYADLTDTAGTRKVEVYKDAAKTAKVAEGTKVGDGTLTLSAINDSGISGTVDVTWVDNETDVNLEIKQLTWTSLANTYDTYLTLWFEDGIRTIRMQDCVITSLTFESVEKSSLTAALEISGRAFTEAATSVALSIASQFDVYCHKKFVLKDLAYSITESGDAGDELDSWVLYGVIPKVNTDSANKLYAVLTDAAGVRTVSVYKDVAKTLKVAEGTLTGDGTLTLKEKTSSGIWGSVDVTYDDGEAAVVLTIGEAELGVRSFSLSLTHEFDAFQGNSIYPLKHVKEAFLAVRGNLKSKYSDETREFFTRADVDPLATKPLEATYTIGTETLLFEMKEVDFEGEPPAFADGKFEDFDSDFEALSKPGTSGWEPVDITLDLT